MMPWAFLAQQFSHLSSTARFIALSICNGVACGGAYAAVLQHSDDFHTLFGMKSRPEPCELSMFRRMRHGCGVPGK